MGGSVFPCSWCVRLGVHEAEHCSATGLYCWGVCGCVPVYVCVHVWVCVVVCASVCVWLLTCVSVTMCTVVSMCLAVGVYPVVCVGVCLCARVCGCVPLCATRVCAWPSTFPCHRWCTHGAEHSRAAACVCVWPVAGCVTAREAVPVGVCWLCCPDHAEDVNPQQLPQPAPRSTQPSPAAPAGPGPRHGLAL